MRLMYIISAYYVYYMQPYKAFKRNKNSGLGFASLHILTHLCGLPLVNNNDQYKEINANLCTSSH